MKSTEPHLYRRLRTAGALIIAGLVVEMLSLIRVHALAFLAFIFIGGGFLVAGIAVYLYSIVDAPSTRGTEPS